MSKLLNSLDKKPFQCYTIEHGIERIKIQIPLKEALNFENGFADFIKEGLSSKSELMDLVNRHGGYIRKDSVS